MSSLGRKKKIFVIALIAVIIAELGYILATTGIARIFISKSPTPQASEKSFAKFLEDLIGRRFAAYILSTTEKGYVIVRFVLDELYKNPSNEFCNSSNYLANKVISYGLIDFIVPSSAGSSYTPTTIQTLYNIFNEVCKFSKYTYKNIPIPLSIALLSYYNVTNFAIEFTKNIVTDWLTLSNNTLNITNINNEVSITKKLSSYDLFEYPIIEINMSNCIECIINLKLVLQNITEVEFTQPLITLPEVNNFRIFRKVVIPYLINIIDKISTLGDVNVTIVLKLVSGNELSIYSIKFGKLTPNVLCLDCNYPMLIISTSESKEIEYVIMSEYAVNSTYLATLLR